MRATTCAWVAGSMLSLIGISASGAAEGQLTRTQIAKLGKAATALVEVGDGRGAPFGQQGYGSAFCVHRSGLFVTNEHVVHPPNPFGGVQQAADRPITLVVNPGDKDEKSYSARVIRADKDLDLALLRVEGGRDFPALAVGDDTKLEELMDVVAFGFPFGTGIAGQEGTPFGQPPRGGRKEYPAVSVNAGSITALRRKAGNLDRIQLDATINPGNSGGPVLDKEGKVIGVIVSMAVAQRLGRTGISHAIPSSHLSRFLARPDIEFDPPVLSPANIHRSVLFEARVVPLLPSATPPTVELILKPGRGQERSYRLEGNGTRYKVRVVPLPPPPGPQRLRLMARFDNALLNATVADRAIKVGDRSVQLSEVKSVRPGPGPRVLLHDGKTLDGTVSGLDEVPVELGDQSLSVNLAKAAEVKFGPAVATDQMWYTLLVRQGDQEVLRQTESLVIAGFLPIPTAAAGPTGIMRPSLDANPAVRKLAAPVADVAVGGAGRYLVLHLPSVHKLAVFDVNAADVVGYIPIKEDTARFAAGRDHVVVLLPGAGSMERWSLKTLEREVVTPLPIKATIKAVAMGSASNGPLLVQTEPANDRGMMMSRFALVSVDTMKLAQEEIPVGQMQIMLMSNSLVHIRASANGKVFGMWCTSHSPTGMGVIVASDSGVQSYYAHTSVGHVVPSPDGKWLCTRSGKYAPQVSMTQSISLGSEPLLPACHGDYYLTLPPLPGAGMRPFPARPGTPQPAQVPAGKARAVTVRSGSSDKPIATLTDLDLIVGSEDGIKHDLTLDKRIHLIPEARLIITIPASNDRLVLYGFGG